jgi:hypothetical protein
MNTEVVSIIVTVVLAFVGYIATYANNLRTARIKERLNLVNKRIDDFYGPLYVGSRVGYIAWRTLLDKYQREGLFFDEGKPPSEEQLREWQIWVENVFMPLNELREKLILENAYLIREEEMPDCLLRFVTHVSSYKAMIKKWSTGDFSEYIPLIEFPAEMTEYAAKSYQELKTEQLKLISKAG